MFIYVINARRIIKPVKIIAFVLVCAIAVGILVGTFEAKTSAEASTEGTRVIIIDAGHGGEDPGAVGVNGVYEKDLNLEIAFTLGEELKSRGYTVVYTRTEDKLLYTPEENIKGMRKISDLKNRCRISAEYHAPIFVSIHMNTYGASKYSGLQVYYADKNEESRILANKIQGAVKRELQHENKRTVKSGSSIYVLENASGTAVLIECGFLSNPEECEKLSEKEYQKQLSFSVICGIIEYIDENGGAA